MGVSAGSMPLLDLNLLTALDALLTEGSVAAAARRLNLSSSAMSRSLARLRSATGDPLLVRAGRGLAPTPRAVELRDRVQALNREAQAVLRPAETALNIAALERTFAIRANEGFIDVFATALTAEIMEAAPGVRLRFAPKPDKDPRPLREGFVDLEIGVLGDQGPEVRAQTLFRDHFIGIVRAGHPLLTDGEVTPARYAAFGHAVASRRGRAAGPVDEALEVQGLRRSVVVVVPGFSAVARIARGSDLVGLVTRSYLGADASRDIAQGIEGFALPVRTPEIAVSLMWHPRMDVDPANRWLRGVVATVCGANAARRLRG